MSIEFAQTDSEQARKHFSTYQMFLFHFENILREQDENETAILSRLLREQKQYLNNTRRSVLTDQHRTRVQKLLFNAWNSELVARLNSSFDQSLRTVTNHWKPIQAYYAMYFLLTPIRKVKTVEEFDRGFDTHAKTLNFATNSLCANLPKPWRCTFKRRRARLGGFSSKPGITCKKRLESQP